MYDSSLLWPYTINLQDVHLIISPRSFLSYSSSSISSGASPLMVSQVILGAVVSISSHTCLGLRTQVSTFFSTGVFTGSLLQISLVTFSQGGRWLGSASLLNTCLGTKWTGSQTSTSLHSPFS